jgi:hypothetical protein
MIDTRIVCSDCADSKVNNPTIPNDGKLHCSECGREIDSDTLTAKMLSIIDSLSPQIDKLFSAQEELL